MAYPVQLIFPRFECLDEFVTMAASLPRKASPCANDTDRLNKTTRIDDSLALERIPSRYFETFEDLLGYYSQG